MMAQKNPCGAAHRGQAEMKTHACFKAPASLNCA